MKNKQMIVVRDVEIRSGVLRLLGIVLVQIQTKKCIQNAVKNGTHMSILSCTSIV